MTLCTSGEMDGAETGGTSVALMPRWSTPSAAQECVACVDTSGLKESASARARAPSDGKFSWYSVYKW